MAIYSALKMVIFHSYVSLPEGTSGVGPPARPHTAEPSGNAETKEQR